MLSGPAQDRPQDSVGVRNETVHIKSSQSKRRRGESGFTRDFQGPSSEVLVAAVCSRDERIHNYCKEAPGLRDRRAAEIELKGSEYARSSVPEAFDRRPHSGTFSRAIRSHHGPGSLRHGSRPRSKSSIDRPSVLPRAGTRHAALICIQRTVNCLREAGPSRPPADDVVEDRDTRSPAFPTVIPRAPNE